KVECLNALDSKRRSLLRKFYPNTFCLLRNLFMRCRTLKTSIMFSVYAEKRNLIESTKEFNWKNRRIGIILRDADVVVYADENNGSAIAHAQTLRNPLDDGADRAENITCDNHMLKNT
ncbi:hypothetical protein L9F63_009608, partial [Diploptera punctata]